MDSAFANLVPDGLFLGGKWKTTDQKFADVNPATEEPFAEVADASVEDMDAAIAAARTAADEGDWAQRSIEDRAACLLQLADAIDRHAEEFAALATVEWGVAPPHRPMQVDIASHFLRDCAENGAAALAEDDLGKPDWGIKATAMRAPLGVVAAITPWNFPHTINLQKLAPALIAGNSVVLKPSPLSPLAGLGLAKLVDEETDIPAGVVNIVTTSQLAPAELLTSDPRVDMVTFVGSAATARRVGASAAETMKRTLFELGGKSAAIFLDDFDVDNINDDVVINSCTLHAGQACILYTRLLVHSSIYDAFVDRFTSAVAATRVGDPSDPGTQMGPLIDAASRDRVLATIERGVADGARLTTGGGRPQRLDRGFYVEPTVLADVDNSWSIAREEVFGPVTCILRFDDEDQAVRIANDSDYGLVGTVHSSDPDRAEALARHVDAGVVTVNGAPPFGPFGGWKQSGIGREGGAFGIQAYTELRTVTRFG